MSEHTEKFCVDCKHYCGGDCFKFSQVDLVTGKSIAPTCSSVRYNPDKCGVTGRRFEPKLVKASD